jgi:hypothetical protein
MYELIVQNPNGPQPQRNQWAPWMLPITHKPICKMHTLDLEDVLADAEDSLLIQTSLRRLRGINRQTLEGGDLVFDFSTGVYWRLSEGRTHWIALNKPYQVDLSPLALGWIGSQSIIQLPLNWR